MKLSETLPDRITVGKHTMRANFDFKRVLQMMDILSRDDLLPGAREYLALKCVIKHPPKDTHAALEEIKGLLFPHTKKSADAKKLTDFEQDADLIRAAFRQAYGIDLYRDSLHWIEFSALLNALPEGSRYSEVLGIRARPMPKATKYNAEEREWLMKAKAQVALKLSEKEEEQRYEENVVGVFRGLLSLKTDKG
jgi:hypothetical protein